MICDAVDCGAAWLYELKILYTIVYTIYVNQHELFIVSRDFFSVSKYSFLKQKLNFIYIKKVKINLPAKFICKNNAKISAN